MKKYNNYINEKIKLTDNQLFEKYITVELEMRSLDGIKQAVEDGEDINKIDDLYWETPLTMSIRNYFSDNFVYRAEWFEIIKYLIEAGADVNKKDDYNLTPLLTSVSRSRHQVSHEILDLLINNDADWNITDDDNKTFFDYLNYYNQKIIEKTYPEKYKDYLKRKTIKKYKI